MKRRDFLRGSIAASSLAAGLGATVLFERNARAFGEVPKDGEASMPPPAERAESILEIFLYGGVSQYESFYCVDAYGKADSTHYWLFHDTGDLDAAAAQCGLSGPLLEDFALDANGMTVKLGPFVAPLRKRPDVVSRMRVAITAHDLEPHEGAIPLALAGRGLGHPALAGLGAHVQRYFLDKEGATGRAPYSYVLSSSSVASLPTDNLRAAIATGTHPGATRPLMLTVDAAGDLATLLARGKVGDRRAAYDAVVQGSIERYATRLRWKGQGAPLRSHRLADLTAAASSVAHSDAIAGVLDPAFFAPVPGNRCGDAVDANATRMQLELAAHLLTHPTAPARHVCVLDGGLLPADGGGGYDTHFETPHTLARNLGNLLESLMGVINAPGEANPAKLDLDKTLIVLTTEFGRTPYLQSDKGRNHWPYGFPVVFLGGPITPSRKGVFGACGPDAKATLASSPQENKIAALMALGIWPFAQESFNVSDVPSASGEAEAAAKVLARQLGYGT